MNWDDKGFLISKNKYNENSLIVDIYTKNHGKVSGIIFGLLLGIISFPSIYEDPIVLFLSFGGDVFLKLIKMLVVPIVFFFFD